MYVFVCVCVFTDLLRNKLADVLVGVLLAVR